eukprot:scaffold358_cov256-Pinguiococcus_pyrenoidosus.AAC.37
MGPLSAHDLWVAARVVGRFHVLRGDHAVAGLVQNSVGLMDEIQPALVDLSAEGQHELRHAHGAIAVRVEVIEQNREVFARHVHVVPLQPVLQVLPVHAGMPPAHDLEAPVQRPHALAPSALDHVKHPLHQTLWGEGWRQRAELDRILGALRRDEHELVLLQLAQGDGVGRGVAVELAAEALTLADAGRVVAAGFPLRSKVGSIRHLRVGRKIHVRLAVDDDDFRVRLDRLFPGQEAQHATPLVASWLEAFPHRRGSPAPRDEHGLAVADPAGARGRLGFRREVHRGPHEIQLLVDEEGVVDAQIEWLAVAQYPIFARFLVRLFQAPLGHRLDDEGVASRRPRLVADGHQALRGAHRQRLKDVAGQRAARLLVMHEDAVSESKFPGIWGFGEEKAHDSSGRCRKVVLGLHAAVPSPIFRVGMRYALLALFQLRAVTPRATTQQREMPGKSDHCIGLHMRKAAQWFLLAQRECKSHDKHGEGETCPVSQCACTGIGRRIEQSSSQRRQSKVPSGLFSFASELCEDRIFRAFLFEPVPEKRLVAVAHTTLKLLWGELHDAGIATTLAVKQWRLLNGFPLQRFKRQKPTKT